MKTKRKIHIQNHNKTVEITGIYNEERERGEFGTRTI